MDSQKRRLMSMTVEELVVRAMEAVVAVERAITEEETLVAYRRLAEVRTEARRRDGVGAIPKTVIHLVRDEAMALEEREEAGELWAWLRNVEGGDSAGGEEEGGPE